MEFNAVEEAKGCINWIKDWFDNQSGGAKGIALGISGGKDSTVSAKLCASAVGKDRVFGVLMPNGLQSDFEDSREVCREIGIDNDVFNIVDLYDSMQLRYSIYNGYNFSQQSLINIAPRLRMTVLYAISQDKGYRVCGTSNLSERYIGYSTKWGDGACDFNPLANFTSDEVIAIGDALGLSEYLTHKIPSDGLCGKSDEDNIGFTYKALNRYIRTGVCEDTDIKSKIDKMHLQSRHKVDPIPVYGR